MDLNSLPPNIFVNILSYMPLWTRLRLQQVSKYWQEMCLISLEQCPVAIKFDSSLHFKAEDLDRLLQKCHKQVVKINFNPGTLVQAAEIMFVLSEITFPKLMEIFLYWDNNSPLFAQFINNAPNLKILGTDALLSSFKAFSALPNGLEEYRCERLANENDLRFLSSHCPNLKNLHITEFMNWRDTISLDTLNALFSGCTKLSKIDLGSRDETAKLIPLDRCRPFWQLSNVTYLILPAGYYVDDMFLKSVSVSFPLLCYCNLWVRNTITDEGIAVLACLKNLIFLSITNASKKPTELQLATGITTLCQQGRLQYLHMLDISVDVNCVRAIINSCKDMRYLNLAVLDTTEQVLLLVQEASTVFHFQQCRYKTHTIWWEHYLPISDMINRLQRLFTKIRATPNRMIMFTNFRFKKATRTITLTS